jgi:hypothetical protein
LISYDEVRRLKIYVGSWFETSRLEIDIPKFGTWEGFLGYILDLTVNELETRVPVLLYHVLVLFVIQIQLPIISDVNPFIIVLERSIFVPEPHI